MNSWKVSQNILLHYTHPCDDAVTLGNETGKRNLAWGGTAIMLKSEKY